MSSSRAAEALLNLTIKNQLPSIEDVKHHVLTFTYEHRISADMTARINMVIDELVNNIISYAYADSDEHEIHIQLRCDAQQLEITIADDGIAYDPTRQDAPDISRSLEEREIGGLGIHLVHGIMDEVLYQRSGEKNIVTLTKKLDIV